jgi:hypothetical protein
MASGNVLTSVKLTEVTVDHLSPRPLVGFGGRRGLRVCARAGRTGGCVICRIARPGSLTPPPSDHERRARR